jgi:hypothetical protein
MRANICLSKSGGKLISATIARETSHSGTTQIVRYSPGRAKALAATRFRAASCFLMAAFRRLALAFVAMLPAFRARLRVPWAAAKIYDLLGCSRSLFRERTAFCVRQ